MLFDLESKDVSHKFLLRKKKQEIGNIKSPRRHLLTGGGSISTKPRRRNSPRCIGVRNRYRRQQFAVGNHRLTIQSGFLRFFLFFFHVVSSTSSNAGTQQVATRATRQADSSTTQKISSICFL